MISRNSYVSIGMGGYYPGGGGPAPGRSGGAGGEFGGLLKQPFAGRYPNPLNSPQLTDKERQWLNQPFRPKNERPGGQFQTPKPAPPHVPIKPPAPVQPPAPVRPLKPAKPPGKFQLPKGMRPIGKQLMRGHPARRAFDFALDMYQWWTWIPKRPSGIQFPDGWYHHCGDVAQTPPGSCQNYGYGSAPGHTVDCGTTSQTYAGDVGPGMDITRSRGASGAQFHMGEKHLGCQRIRLREVWRIDGPGPESRIRFVPAAPGVTVLPQPPDPIEIPDDYKPPLRWMPPYPAPAPRPGYKPDRSPTEQSQHGPRTNKPGPQPGWNPGKNAPGPGPTKTFNPNTPGDPPTPPGPPRPPPPGGGEHKPPPGTKEKKWKFATSELYQWATWAIGLYSEWSDIVDCFWEGLPPYIKAKYAKASLEAKMKIIYDQWDNLDPNAIAKALIENAIEDYAIGKLGQAGKDAVKQAALHGLWKSPKGLQFDLGAAPPPVPVDGPETEVEKIWRELWETGQ